MSIALEDAQAIIRSHIREILETVTLNVEEINGCILAENVYARIDQPPFDRSPLDGYALRACDTKGASEEHPIICKVIEEIDAGQYPIKEVRSMEATRIMTGAPIPVGADCIIRQEHTDYGDNKVEIYRELNTFDNYCYQGEDSKQNALLVKRDTKLNFLHIGILCAQGIHQVKVYRKPRVLLLTTGDEVVSYKEELPLGKIYNFSHYALKQRLMDCNAEVRAFHVEDNEEKMCTFIKRYAKDCDLILTTGGVSVGRRDILHQVYELLGIEKLFWRAQIKPGSPAMFSVYKETPIISLSGNPFATLATFDLLVREPLSQLSHDPSIAIMYQEAVLQNDYKKYSPSRRYIRAYYENQKVYLPTDNHMSGSIMSMANCNCYIEVPEETKGLHMGDTVRVFTYVNSNN